MNKDKIKEELWRMKIFLKYLITEPFRQLSKLINGLSNSLIWVYVGSIIFIFSFIKKNKFAGIISFVFILMVVLYFEYKRGYFMHLYRKKYKAKARKERELREKNN